MRHPLFLTTAGLAALPAAARAECVTVACRQQFEFQLAVVVGVVVALVAGIVYLLRRAGRAAAARRARQAEGQDAP